MTFTDTFFAVFTVLGGLALFLLGMKIMTDSLRAAAGNRLRGIIARGTRNRVAGLSLGTLLGFLVHSSAATVMTVGFINAGLLALLHSLPVMFGANVGTTLSMQLISFRLTDLAFVAVAVGFFFQLLYPRPTGQSIGRAVLGFGILFVGMDLMTEPMAAHQQAITPWLAGIDGSTVRGLVLGILIAWLFTAIVQSSGATIGLAFVLADAGVFASLEQVYPVVIGAHLGTPTTALLVSLGCNIEAKRGAVANFVFILFAVALALTLMPLFLWLIPLTSADVVHQIANLHTAIMVLAALGLLPLAGFMPGLMRRVMVSKQPEPQGTHLDPDLISKPEQALCAVIRELGRSMTICRTNLDHARQLVREYDSGLLRQIKRNEEVINELKISMRSYLASLTGRYLSRRQALLAQYLIHIVSDIERIGDHIDHLADVAHQQARQRQHAFDGDVLEALLQLFDESRQVVDACIESLGPEVHDFRAAAGNIFAARDRYMENSMRLQESVNQRVAKHDLPPMAGLVFSDYALTLDRLVRHCREIGREQEQPFFGIKAQKLDRVEPPISKKARPPQKVAREKADESEAFTINPVVSPEEEHKRED